MLKDNKYLTRILDYETSCLIVFQLTMANVRNNPPLFALVECCCYTFYKIIHCYAVLLFIPYCLV